MLWYLVTAVISASAGVFCMGCGAALRSSGCGVSETLRLAHMTRHTRTTPPNAASASKRSRLVMK